MRVCKVAIALLTTFLFGAAIAQDSAMNAWSPGLIDGVGIDQRLGEQVPLDVRLIDEAGNPVRFGDYLGDGRPVILALVYYKCPGICNQILAGILASLRAIKKFDAGKEFDVVLVSIDPRETPQDAARKKMSYMVSYNRPTAEQGWHFLTGTEDEVRKLADSVGYAYKWDEGTEQYVHGAGIMVITPQGKVGQYFYGIEYNTRFLEMALIESSQNRIGTLVERIITFCFLYDPETGTYGFVIMRVLRLFGILTVLALGAFILVNLIRERRLRSKTARRNGEVVS